MAQLLDRCPACGKIFAARPGKRWCSACTSQRIDRVELIQDAINRVTDKTVDALAEATGLDIEEVRRLVHSSPILRRQVETDTPCVRCRKRQSQAGSDFCLRCRLELNRAFGEAADELFAKIVPPEYQSHVPGARGGLGLVTALGEKEARSGPTADELSARRGIW